MQNMNEKYIEEKAGICDLETQEDLEKIIRQVISDKGKADKKAVVKRIEKFKLDEETEYLLVEHIYNAIDKAEVE